MRYLTFLLLILFSCSNAEIFAQKITTRNLSTFSEVTIFGGFTKVEFIAGDTEKVEIDYNGADLDKIVTEVLDNSLAIYIQKDFRPTVKNISIKVYYSNIERIVNSGSTDLFLFNPLKGAGLDLSLSGSGNLKGEVAVEKLSVNISGSADVQLWGRAVQQSFSISGSGNIDGKKLNGEEAKVSISGSGDVFLNVNGRVKSSVSGSGKVQNIH